jgi:hypothetical protein
MSKRNTKSFVAILIALELCILAIAALPSRTTTAKAALQTDMPVVFVDPVNVVASIGETFTISVKVFNLSGRFYPTNEAWTEGAPLPPYVPFNWRYNYSLGNLYAFDLRIKWDPTILEYVSHTVTVPVETLAEGILHEPVINATDAVDPVAGTYTLSRSSQAPAPAFNALDANATAFTMTFNVTKVGKCDINFTNVNLVVDWIGLGQPFSVPMEIPHWTVNGQFQTGGLATRIESIQGGALIAGSLKHPVIQDEDMAVRLSLRNDNDTVTDTFNLTLYDGTTLLNVWENQSLGPGAAMTFNHTISAPSAGVHVITAEASILHAGEVKTDELQKNMTVVDTPTLEIDGPSSAVTGTTVSFSAADSVHNDPRGNIVEYRWTIWAPGETAARDSKTGVDVEFTLPPSTERTGNWTVMLVVTDSFGITAQASTGTLNYTSTLLRPATASYRALKTLNVQLSGGPGLNIEWIVLAIILIVIIAVAIFYLRRRSR